MFATATTQAAQTVPTLRLIGLDPGLRHTGWGVIEVTGNHLRHIGDGAVHSEDDAPTATRLRQLHDGLAEVLARFRPGEAAVEETFVNKNAATSLKLGLARGIALLVPALAGLRVAEYPTNLVKKSVVGAGHAAKTQIQVMVRLLLPGCTVTSPDAADALAVAICHAHHRATLNAWAGGAASEKIGGAHTRSSSRSRPSPLAGEDRWGVVATPTVVANPPHPNPSPARGEGLLDLRGEGWPREKGGRS